MADNKELLGSINQLIGQLTKVTLAEKVTEITPKRMKDNPKEFPELIGILKEIKSGNYTSKEVINLLRNQVSLAVKDKLISKETSDNLKSIFATELKLSDKEAKTLRKEITSQGKTNKENNIKFNKVLYDLQNDNSRYYRKTLDLDSKTYTASLGKDLNLKGYLTREETLLGKTLNFFKKKDKMETAKSLFGKGAGGLFMGLGTIFGRGGIMLAAGILGISKKFKEWQDEEEKVKKEQIKDLFLSGRSEDEARGIIEKRLKREGKLSQNEILEVMNNLESTLVSVSEDLKKSQNETLGRIADASDVAILNTKEQMDNFVEESIEALTNVGIYSVKQFETLITSGDKVFEGYKGITDEIKKKLITEIPKKEDSTLLTRIAEATEETTPQIKLLREDLELQNIRKDKDKDDKSKGIFGKIADWFKGLGGWGLLLLNKLGLGGLGSKIFNKLGLASLSKAFGKFGSKIPVIGGLIAGLVTFFSGGGLKKAFGSGLGTTIGAMVGGAIGSIIPGFGTAIGAILGGFLGDWLGTKFGPAIIDGFIPIINALKPLGSIIMEVGGKIWDSLKFFSNILMKGTGFLWEYFVKPLSNLAGGLLEGHFKILISILTGFISIGTSIVSKIWDGWRLIFDGLSWAANEISLVIQPFIDIFVKGATLFSSAIEIITNSVASLGTILSDGIKAVFDGIFDSPLLSWLKPKTEKEEETEKKKEKTEKVQAKTEKIEKGSYSKLLTAGMINPEQSAENIFSKETIEKNKELFKDKKGKTKTVREVATALEIELGDVTEKPKTITSKEKINIKVEKPEPPKEPVLKTEERVIETPQYTLSPKLTEKQKIGAEDASERLMKQKRGIQSTLPGVAGPAEVAGPKPTFEIAKEKQPEKVELKVKASREEFKKQILSTSKPIEAPKEVPKPTFEIAKEKQPEKGYELPSKPTEEQRKFLKSDISKFTPASERLMKEKRGTQSTLPGVAGPAEVASPKLATLEVTKFSEVTKPVEVGVKDIDTSLKEKEIVFKAKEETLRKAKEASKPIAAPTMIPGPQAAPEKRLNQLPSNTEDLAMSALARGWFN